MLVVMKINWKDKKIIGAILCTAILLLLGVVFNPFADFSKIVLVREWGLSNDGPFYQVAVHDSGIVQYEGKEHVVHAGAALGMLSPQEIKQLSDAVPANFFSWPNKIGMCGLWDGENIRIIVEKNFIEHEVQGCPANKEMEKFAKTIDNIIGTERWVGTKEEQKKLPPTFQ